ncbi:LysM peptidoglycan-binding domain-containing protein [Xylanibacillus composti]|uniref:Metallophosphatase n=1 Tax=Xylanibacillus composti TaxID=1572762 RepID=A0A8J4H313_9BACL|nr:5'-nucleotidase C-terminal domain-containing protein [Xylanibacillus composti]MDT9726485.1 LysM peptidoglycan-binding domain-containing protein [Xylanibacillus composti]GIQ69944.1 metallophosphatase [Xylanibacillus composti]
MKGSKISFLLSMLFMVTLLVPAVAFGADGEDGTKITIVHINDVHSRVESGIGYAKLAAFVDQQRAANPNTLVLDAGDTLHGQTIATLVRGESIVRMLNAVGLDAMAAGNHDFNFGTERLLELADMAEFPILGANVEKDGEAILQDHLIKEVGGVKVGIFGLATPETAYKTHPNNVEGITFVDPVVSAQAQVDQLRDQVDILIALAHLGTDASSVDTSTKVAEQVAGIDLIVDGHSHEEVSTYVGETLIVQTGEYLNNVGLVQLTVQEGVLVHATTELIAAEELEALEPDAEVQAVIDEIKAEQNTVLEEVVGASQTALDGERETVRAGESNLGNLIADAMLAVTGADAALTNGGGIRASIGEGEITKGDVITVLPFGNYVVTIEVTGEEIVQALQHGAGDYPEPKGAFPQVGGISFSVDAAKPNGEKVHNVKVNGNPVQLDQTYVLATNDFLAAGGDEYTMFSDNEVTGHYQALDEALIEYIQTIGEVAYAPEGRITEEAVPVDANGDSAAAEAAEAGAGEAGQEVPAAEAVQETSVDEAANAGAASSEAIEQAPAASGNVPAPVQEAKVHTVKPGDTLSHIGVAHGLSWQELAAFNNLANPHLIFPNQQIRIPVR